MNINKYCAIEEAAELWDISTAATRRMDEEGVINLRQEDTKLWVNVEQLRRVVEAAEDCPSLLHCECSGPCNCSEDS